PIQQMAYPKASRISGQPILQPVALRIQLHASLGEQCQAQTQACAFVLEGLVPCTKTPVPALEQPALQARLEGAEHERTPSVVREGVKVDGRHPPALVHPPIPVPARLAVSEAQIEPALEGAVCVADT